jgi:RNA polymerase sigma-70 factor (ECF subfamily)
MDTNQPDPSSDRELARLVSEYGDESAFRILYRRHTPAVYAFVLRILGGATHDAEDVVQDTWVRATKALDGFRWDASLRTWLIGIALNRAREALRSRSRSREVSSDALGPTHALTPAPDADPGEGLDLERAIRQLPDGYRTVFVLHDVHGFKHDEIGARLGITSGSSRSQLFHARRALRELLGSTRGAARPPESGGAPLENRARHEVIDSPENGLGGLQHV